MEVDEKKFEVKVEVKEEEESSSNGIVFQLIFFLQLCKKIFKLEELCQVFMLILEVLY